MVEMYPKGVISAAEYDRKDFLDQYIYFDGDSEFYVYDPDTNSVYGGMLSRIFDQKELLRTKIPLYYHTSNRFLVGSHHIFPLKEDISFPFGTILKHYKFLPGDYGKVKEAIEKKNYANHSMMYKKYIKFYDDERGISAFSKYSRKWTSYATDEFKIIQHLGG